MSLLLEYLLRRRERKLFRKDHLLHCPEHLQMEGELKQTLNVKYSSFCEALQEDLLPHFLAILVYVVGLRCI